jgi:hypothetical protein
MRKTAFQLVEESTPGEISAEQPVKRPPHDRRQPAKT